MRTKQKENVCFSLLCECYEKTQRAALPNAARCVVTRGTLRLPSRHVTFFEASGSVFVSPVFKHVPEELKELTQFLCSFPDFLDDLLTAGTRNADVCAYDNHVLISRKSFEVDG